MFHVTILDTMGTPIMIEVSHEVFQVFSEYEREMERQRKADSRHRDCFSSKLTANMVYSPIGGESMDSPAVPDNTIRKAL